MLVLTGSSYVHADILLVFFLMAWCLLCWGVIYKRLHPVGLRKLEINNMYTDGCLDKADVSIVDGNCEVL